MKLISLLFLAINIFIFFNMCECEANRSMDIKTPRNVYLSAFYKRSFAFYTVKNRMPVILTGLIDNLARNKMQIADEYGGETAREELKTIIGEISEFKYEIQTNKPLKKLTGEAPDIEIYNEYIQKQTTEDGQPTYFHTIWLLAECYMYRRIRQIFEEKELLKDYDPFRFQKQEAYRIALPLMIQLGQHLLDTLNKHPEPNMIEFISLIKLNLWGNKCDLSISLGRVAQNSTLFDTATLDPNILSDQSEEIWKAISTSNSSDIVDIVLDNSGYELFTDMCLADYIISKNLAKYVRFYVKIMPWFISDVMTQDFNWTIEQLQLSDNLTFKELGDRWGDYLENGTWSIVESDFWTLPFEFNYMPKVDPKLYEKLADAKVAFFKGDLNYRKLFGEMNWDPSTPVDVGLQSFHPTKLCILRTIKADIVCGLAEGIAEKVEAEDPNWMETGDWGLIQFSGKIVKID